MAKYLSEAGLAHLWTDVLKPLFASKVDKVTGKGLSSLDFTQAYLNRIGAAEDGITTLGSTKVDKIGGKGLSTNDFTNEQVAELVELRTDVTALEEFRNTPIIESTITIFAANWTGSSAPYENIATAAGISAESSDVDASFKGEGSSAQQREASRNAQIQPIGYADGTITFIADGVKPAIDIPVLVRRRG